MSLSKITIKTDETLKKEFNLICEELGLNMSVAINMFMKAVLREQKIPFELKLEPNELTYRIIEEAEAETETNINGPYETVSELMEALNA